MVSSDNPYSILGLSSGATNSQIKEAFESSIRDIVNKGRTRAIKEADRLVEILIAYSILINPVKRQIYDGVDHYKTLEVDRDSSTKQIRQSFRRLARLHHPDVNPGSRDAEDRFKRINEAYEVLSDPIERQIYDRLWTTFREWIGQGNSPLEFEWPTSIQVQTRKDNIIAYETIELNLRLLAPEEMRSIDLGNQILSSIEWPEQPLLLPAQASPSSKIVDDVYFMVCHPKEVLPEKWYSLLAYAYVESVLELVRQDALKFSDEMAHMQREIRSKNPTRVQRGTKILLIPEAEGIEFKPASLILRFDEDFERASFRFSANSSLAGEPCFGEMGVFVGPVQVANIRFSVFVSDSVNELTVLSKGRVEVATKMYQKIFVSYSHKDTGVVSACKHAFESLGHDVMVDFDTLRSGEAWDARLLQLIDEADVFQLFWSKNSSVSENVRKEWTHALELSKEPVQREFPSEGFIRPVFWEKPMPDPPSELAHLHFKYLPTLAKLGAVSNE